jgi:flagellar hook-associated protein 2
MPISLDSINNLSPELQRAFQGAAQAERKQVQSLADKKGAVDEKVKLLDDCLTKVHGVRKLLPDMATPLSLRELALNTGDNRVLTGTVDKSLAEPGKYNIEVMQLASSATAVSNSFADKDQTRIGTGYLTFTTAAGDTKEIYIDNENATLEGISRVINNSRLGIRASIVNDASDPDSPYRMLFTAEGAGAGKDVEYPEFYFIDGESDFFIDNKKPAENAKVRFEGSSSTSRTRSRTWFRA